MSKRRILLFLCSVFIPALVVIGLSYGIGGVVTLVEENNELRENVTKIETDNKFLKARIDGLKGMVDERDIIIDTLEQTKVKQSSRIQEIESINLQLNEDLKKLKEEKAKVVSSMPSRGEPSGKSFYVEASAYTALCNEGCTGITATGIDLRKNRDAKVIAVDPRIIPLGTKVHVEGYGYAIAGDTGGAIKGYKIDLHVPTNQEAIQWGRRKVKLTILN